MTNKEAIDQLKTLQLHCTMQMLHKHHEPWESDNEALDLAIKALEFQSNIKEACGCSCGFELTEYIREEVRKYEQ